jgi:hypothetical protein
MASFVKFHQFAEDVANKVHDLVGTQDTLMVVLTNNPPIVGTDQVLANIVQIAAGNGYVTDGMDIQNDGSEAAGVVTITAQDVIWTAGPANMAGFRYAVIYNSTPVSPLKPLIGYYDYGATVTVLAGETFKIDFGPVFLTVQ